MHKLFVLLFCFLFATKYVSASLTINEIYPAPVTGDFEWVELYNNGNDATDLTQYLLTDLANNKIKINEATLSANSYLTTSCSSILNNSSDTVFLKNAQGEIIETATYSGTFASDKSYVKCANNNWLTTSVITKNFTNETACLSPTFTPTPTEEITPTPVSYDNIYLFEVYPYPATGENEWVEIYNANDYQVELTDWYLDDMEDGGSSPKVFSLTIDTKNYAVFDLTSSMFNNSGDTVRLLDYNKLQKDSFEYTDAEIEKSFGRIGYDSNEFCLQESSKNTANSGCIDTSPTSTPTPSVTSYPPPITKHQLPITKNQSLNTNYQSLVNSPQVLGEKTNISLLKNNQKPLVKTLSFIASVNSLLTIISILLKIKLHEALD